MFNAVGIGEVSDDTSDDKSDSDDILSFQQTGEREGRRESRGAEFRLAIPKFQLVDFELKSCRTFL